MRILGSFEKSIIGLLVILFGIYFALDHYMPSIFYPELNKVRGNLSASISLTPRKGLVVPASGDSAYLSDSSSFLTRDEFASITGTSQFDASMINWFAKGTDGQLHPSNAYLVGFAPFYTSKYWLPLLAVSLRVRYMRDSEIKIDDDIWQTSPETYVSMRGDCEDHAILLADWMIDLGYDARVVAGTVNGAGDAWVVLYKDGNEYLLEATDKASRRRFPFVSLHPEYVPAFMFNRDHFWAVITENRGWHNRLSTKSWAVLSDFKEMLF